MAAADRLSDPTREARRFGLVLAATIALAGGVILPWLRDRPWPVWPYALGLAIALWALVHPESLAPIRRRIGTIQTRLVLGAVFFLVITPVGLVRRALGHDPLERRRDPGAVSYRSPKERRTAASLERPF